LAVFHYQAIDERGKKRKGFIEAASESEAKQKLRDQGVLVTQISTSMGLKRKQNLKSEQRLAFTNMLSQLINSGLPLYESLLTLEEQVRNEPYHRIVLSLTEQVKAGTTLSDAMRNFPDSFDRLYTSMIGAGEAAGSLDVVLKRLTQLLSRQAKLRKQITNALIYPAILAVFALSVIVLLMGFVVPSIESVFEGRQLNAYTEFVLSVSRFLRSWWWLLVPAIGLGIAGIIYFLRSPKGKLWSERQLMRLPFIRDLLIQAALVRFSRTMSTLQEGGLPLVNALALSREVMQNHSMEEEVGRAEKKILEGGNLSTELKRSRYFPLLATRMMAVGEESGHLSHMLSQVADMYEDSLEKTIDRIMALTQPAILIIMGALIGLVLLAILLPMTDISAFTR
jgi:general secretion pathway protein F/type IV pilus assembly protein PilC